MLLQQFPHLREFLIIGRDRVDELAIQPGGQERFFVDDERPTTGHASPEVVSERAEYQDRPARHVLTRMVTGAFDDGRRTTVSNCEALTNPTCYEELAAGRAVQHGVARQDWIARVIRWWSHHDPTPALTFADVVVGLADEVERDPISQEGTEALSCRAGEPRLDRTRR